MRKLLLLLLLICCISAFAQPANDLCSNATVVTPSAGSIPVFINASSKNGTASMAGCSGTATADVWFKFTATATQHTFYVRHGLSGATNAVIQLFSGACNTLNSIFCKNFGTNSNYANTLVVEQAALTIGADYYFRVYYSGTSNDFEVAVTAPPANDNCANAISLPVSAGNATTFAENNLIGATTQVPATTCNTTSNNELWYSFTATQTSHNLDVLQNSSMASQLFTGDCNSLTPLPCTFLQENIGDTLRTYLENLIPGTNYLMKIYSTNSFVIGRFSIGMGTPYIAPNDRCAGAINLVPATGTCTSIPVSFKGALPNGFQDGICNPGPFANIVDVWYKFVATSPFISIQFDQQDQTNWSRWLDIYEGSCAGLTPLPCSGNPADFGQLTVGSTYYIRLAKSGGLPLDSMGSLCISIPNTQSNDECANALTVPVQNAGLSDYKQYHNLQSTFSFATSKLLSLSAVTRKNDVYFKFVATSDKTLVGFTPENGQFIEYAIFKGDCITPEIIWALNQPASGTKLVLNTLVGETYYLRIGSVKKGYFGLSISEAKPPSNNECSAAISITPAARMNTASPNRVVFEQATLSMPSCLFGYTSDVWFQFTAPSDSVGISITNGFSQFGYQVFSGNCASLVSVKCSTITATSTVTSNHVIAQLQAGTTYYLRLLSNTVSAEMEAFNPFLHLFDAKKRGNDYCTQALELTVQSSQGYQLLEGTLSGTYTDVTGCTTTPDVWYKFTATATSHNITVRGSLFPRIAMYTGSCGSLTLIPSGCFGSTLGTETRTVTGLTPGTVYFIRVSSSSSSAQNGVFGIAVTNNVQPSNDDCNSSINLDVCTTGNCPTDKYYSTRGATASAAGAVPAGNCTFFGSPGDVWFSFTGTGKMVNIETVSTNENFLFQVYTGTCNGLSFVSCNRNNGVLRMATTLGEKYSIRVHGQLTNATLDFTIKVYEQPEINENSLVNVNCTGTNLVLNPGFETLKDPTNCPGTFVTQPGFGSYSYDLLSVSHWKMPSYATTDIYASCSNVSSSVNPLFNLCMGFETPRSGGNYAGIYAHINNQNYSEYLQGKLSQTLMPGKQYLVQFNVSLADYALLAISRLGVYFSGTEIAYEGTGVLPFTPQLETPAGQFFTQKEGWQTISFLYTPTEEVEYFVIGNFRHNLQAETLDVPVNRGSNAGGASNGCGGTETGAAFAYYFVDDVFISEVIGNGCLLPIDDLAWEAIGKQGQGIITWRKNDETGVASYSIEHSINGSAFDVVYREQVASLSSYRFVDHKLTTGKHFYRIRVHYKDGQTEVTGIKTIEISSPGRIQVYPTVTKGNVMIRGMVTPSQVQVIMPQGSVLQRHVMNGDGSIDLSRYPAGLYIITITNTRKDNLYFRVIKE